MNVYVASVTLLPVTSNPLQTLLQALLRLGPKRPVHVTGGYPPGWIESGIGYKKWIFLSQDIRRMVGLSC
jgi:hypothetical protein